MRKVKVLVSIQLPGNEVLCDQLAHKTWWHDMSLSYTLLCGYIHSVYSKSCESMTCPDTTSANWQLARGELCGCRHAVYWCWLLMQVDVESEMRVAGLTQLLISHTPTPSPPTQMNNKHSALSPVLRIHNSHQVFAKLLETDVYWPQPDNKLPLHRWSASAEVALLHCTASAVCLHLAPLLLVAVREKSWPVVYLHPQRAEETKIWNNEMLFCNICLVISWSHGQREQLNVITREYGGNEARITRKLFWKPRVGVCQVKTSLRQLAKYVMEIHALTLWAPYRCFASSHAFP